jgi:hypothetical protein
LLVLPTSKLLPELHSSLLLCWYYPLQNCRKKPIQALAGCRDCIQSTVLKLFSESKWGSQRCKIHSFKITQVEQLKDTLGLLHLCERQLLSVTDTDRWQHPNKDSGLPSREHDYLINRHRLQELTQPKYEILCQVREFRNTHHDVGNTTNETSREATCINEKKEPEWRKWQGYQGREWRRKV